MRRQRTACFASPKPQFRLGGGSRNGRIVPTERPVLLQDRLPRGGVTGLPRNPHAPGNRSSGLLAHTRTKVQSGTLGARIHPYIESGLPHARPARAAPSTRASCRDARWNGINGGHLARPLRSKRRTRLPHPRGGHTASLWQRRERGYDNPHFIRSMRSRDTHC